MIRSWLAPNTTHDAAEIARIRRFLEAAGVEVRSPAKIVRFPANQNHSGPPTAA
jgi:hypothetical protein